MKHRNVLMLLLSIGIMVAMISAASADDWESFQGNNNNNGVTGDDITTTFNTNWDFDAAGIGWTGFDSAPVIGNGIAYFVYSNASVYALNLTTGNPVWIDTTFASATSFEIGTPAYDSENNRLYVGLSYGNTTDGTTVVAFNASTGVVEWYNDTLIPAEYQINSPLKYEDGKVYVPAANMTEVASWTYVAQQGGLYCLDADTGVAEWTNTTGYGYYYAAPAINEGFIIIGDDAGIIRVYDKDDGTFKDSFDASAALSTPLQIRSAVVYDHGPGSGDDTNSVLYFTATASPSGSEAYVFAIDFDISNGQLDETSYDTTVDIGSRCTSSIAVTDNYVYLATQGGVVNVYGISYNGHFIYGGYPVDSTTALGSSFTSSPVVTTADLASDDIERVYVTHNSATGGLYYYEFDVDDEEFVDDGSWIPNGSGYTLQGIAAADGWLVFGNDNKKAFGASN